MTDRCLLIIFQAMTDEILFITQIIGSIAFAISGALVGIQKKMDVFGIVILGVVTSTGGGVIRDLVLGINPPLMFINPVYAGVATVTSLIVFLPKVRGYLTKEHKYFSTALIFADSLGLSIFTVVGIQTAFNMSQEYGVFLLCFVGLITGTGGGILRDVLSGQTPFIFIRNFYACAAIIGALVCVFLWKTTGQMVAMLAGSSVIMILRILAAHYHWSLPRA